ncbi:ribbon-helix-helix DNA binding domain protein [Microbacterium phage Welcome]|nr:ribbon-helix-helix DNA binding domain protein [Microbacterium phage Welcome]QYC54237.1 ribbon-helix-helix DNA binding domain protein [Microbacterium phage Welcome]
MLLGCIRVWQRPWAGLGEPMSDCEHDNGVEWVGDDDGAIYACVMCGEQLECS